MAKPKIAFFFPNFEVGGAERVTLNLLQGLDRRHFDCSLVLGEKKGYYLQELPADISVAALGTQRFFSLFIKLIKYFRRAEPDIFISVFPHFSLISILARNFSRAKTRIVIIEHSLFSRSAVNAQTLPRRLVARFIFPYLMKIFYRQAEAIIAVSKGVAEDIGRITRLKDKIKIIYNPIVNEAIYILMKENIKHPWFLSQEAPTLLAVGRLAKAKDYPTLLRAFALVLKKEPARLVILGEGSEKKRIEKLSRMLGISKNIAFLGLQKNPYKYMAKSSIFVLSSQQEGFSTVIVEAMACGLPVVATDCETGPREIIKQGKSGFLVPVGDYAALAKAIIKLLKDYPLRKKFSEEGKKRAGDFGIKRGVEAYKSFLLGLLKNHA